MVEFYAIKDWGEFENIEELYSFMKNNPEYRLGIHSLRSYNLNDLKIKVDKGKPIEENIGKTIFFSIGKDAVTDLSGKIVAINKDRYIVESLGQLFYKYPSEVGL